MALSLFKVSPRILVTGRNGSGKSSLINKLTEKLAKVGDTVSPTQREAAAKTLDHDEIDGNTIPIKFIDTQGFSDTAISDRQISENVHVVFICHKLYERVDGPVIKELEKLVRILGNELMEHVIIVFTCGDEYVTNCRSKPDKDLSYHDQMKSQAESIKKVMITVLMSNGISQETADNIPYCITSADQDDLPTGNWINDLWKKCVSKCSLGDGMTAGEAAVVGSLIGTTVGAAALPKYDHKSLSVKAKDDIKTSEDRNRNLKLWNLKDHISDISRVFNNNLHSFSVDKMGLIYHCSQYGVTLIIPEGAVQESTTVWFGARLFSDKFKFGKYVPVTPIVWVYTEEKLIKPAELHLPHHIDVDTTEKRQLIHLVASDETFIKNYSFQFIASKNDFEITAHLFKTTCHHFCSHCISVDKGAYRKIKKRYSIVIAQKVEDTKLYFDFCLHPAQAPCREVVNEQFKDLNYTIIKRIPIIFNDKKKIETKFEPNDVEGWQREALSVPEEITEELADYFAVMGSPDNVEKGDIDYLKLLEDDKTYPPRLQYIYTHLDVNQELKQRVFFNGLGKHENFLITWEPEGSVTSVRSEASASLTNTPTDISPNSTDTIMLKILVFLWDNNMSFVSGKWFALGYGLGISVEHLHDIELDYNSVDQYLREIVLLWRSNNKESSWEPVAKALITIKLQPLADQLRNDFEEQSSALSQSIQLTGVQSTSAVDEHKNTSARQFRQISDKLSDAVSSSVIKVSSALNAKSLIALSVHSYIIEHQDIKLTKARRLVHELLLMLNNLSEDDSKEKLQEVYTTLKSIQEPQITDIVQPYIKL